MLDRASARSQPFRPLACGASSSRCICSSPSSTRAARRSPRIRASTRWRGDSSPGRASDQLRHAARPSGNFEIFRTASRHLVSGQDLYAEYPAEHTDRFKYSPTFALLFAPFAWLPWPLALLLLEPAQRAPALRRRRARAAADDARMLAQASAAARGAARDAERAEQRARRCPHRFRLRRHGAAAELARGARGGARRVREDLSARRAHLRHRRVGARIRTGVAAAAAGAALVALPLLRHSRPPRSRRSTAPGAASRAPTRSSAGSP